jgi:hypothetical protein
MISISSLHQLLPRIGLVAHTIQITSDSHTLSATAAELVCVVPTHLLCPQLRPNSVYAHASRLLLSLRRQHASTTLGFERSVVCVLEQHIVREALWLLATPTHACLPPLFTTSIRSHESDRSQPAFAPVDGLCTPTLTPVCICTACLTLIVDTSVLCHPY